jgi:sn-glycerol 3-phosphate transport system substrate-binding protein
MMFMRLPRFAFSFVFGFVLFTLSLPAARAATELQFWHSMEGALGEALVELTTAFNAEQSEYRVVPVYKGSYEETISAALAAAKAGNAPNIVQAYDVATANMMNARSLIRPAQQILADAGEKLPANTYAPSISSYYSDSRGTLMALPFNVSTPVLFYNRALFQKAGLDPNKPLTTWYDLQAALLSMQAAGSRCGMTVTWPAWTLLENTLIWHNEEFATRNNGFDGADAQLSFNTRLAIRHISLLTTWMKSGLFTYAGRRDEGEALFLKGDCGFLLGSSASYANLKRNAPFDFDLMFMPHYDDINAKAPFNTSIGGAALWAMSGQKTAEYRGVGKFFAYLAEPKTQAQWHQRTGYLPLSLAAYELTKKSGFYDAFPGIHIAVRQVTNGPPAPFSRGVRLGNQAQVRNIIDEELEQIWALTKPPKKGLDDAVTRGNEALRRFEKAGKQ